MNNIVLDSDIFLNIGLPSRQNEFINSKRIIDSIKRGENKGLVPSPVLMEIYYRVSQIKGEDEGKKFTKWILSLLFRNFRIIEINREHGLSAGKLYFKYNFVYLSVTSKWVRKPSEDCLSAVDALILAIAQTTTPSSACTYDKDMLKVQEIDVKKPEDFFT